MDRHDAVDKLLEIMEIVETANGDCKSCPFCNLTPYSHCPFEVCPGEWEFEA